MLKTLYEEIGAAPARRRRRRRADSADAAAARRRRRAARATIRPTATFRVAHAAQQGRARRRRPGMSSSISTDSGLDYAVGDAFGVFPTNDPALVEAVIAALGAPPDLPIGGRTLREVLTDGVSLVARAGHAVPAHLLPHRRRAAAEGEGAGGGRGSRRRRGDARRAGGAGEISRRAARSGSLRRGARAAAAAALFDLVVAQGASRPRVAHRRRGALRRSAGRTRLGVASTFLAERVAAGRHAPGLCAEGAWLRPAGRSGDADHHGRPRHRRRAVPRLPARAHGDQGAGPQLAVLRPSAPRHATSSTRTSSPA